MSNFFIPLKAVEWHMRVVMSAGGSSIVCTSKAWYSENWNFRLHSVIHGCTRRAGEKGDLSIIPSKLISDEALAICAKVASLQQIKQIFWDHVHKNWYVKQSFRRIELPPADRHRRPFPWVARRRLSHYERGELVCCLTWVIQIRHSSPFCGEDWPKVVRAGRVRRDR